jgi:hypothetical protein
METIFDWKYASVHYDPDSLILFINWKNKVGLEEYQRVMIEMLEYGKIHTIEGFISDIRKQTTVNLENSKWFVREILPSAIKDCGLKRAAVIHEGTKNQKAYLKKIAHLASARFNFKIKTTQSEKQAFNWLKRQQKLSSLFSI